jgi:hypothetical protein
MQTKSRGCSAYAKPHRYCTAANDAARYALLNYPRSHVKNCIRNNNNKNNISSIHVTEQLNMLNTGYNGLITKMKIYGRFEAGM